MDWTRFETVVGFVGSLLGIIAFVCQFWPNLRPKRLTADAPDLREPLAPELKSKIALTSKPDTARAKGVLFAVLAALIWSISHNTFRTPSSLSCSSEIMAALVFLGGGFCVSVYCLLLDYVGGKSNVAPTLNEVLSVIASRVGIIAVLLNAIEFVLYLRAIHLITAGQTMALWKTNPLWTLIILAFMLRKGVQRASIAAAFCVVAGVYVVLSPQISGATAQWDVSGSLSAIVGGATFAGYACAIHLILLKRPDTTALFRYWVQAAILVTTGVILCIFNSVSGQNTTLSLYTVGVLAFNSVRIATTYILYSESIALTKSPVLVASIVCLEVPITMLIEYLWFGNTTATNVLVGAGMIIIGILSILKENDDLWQALRGAFARVSGTVENSKD